MQEKLGQLSQYGEYAMGMDDRGIRVRFSGGVRDLFLLHSVQTSSGIHPGSY
jgi:hypothetical protein